MAENLGKEIIRGLQEFLDTLKDKEPIGKKYKVSYRIKKVRKK